MSQPGYSKTLFEGKTVVITGAGRGIGFSTAKAFADCGATVIAHSGRASSSDNILDTKISSFEADFTDRDQIENFLDYVRTKTDRVDVLINNAGTMHGRFPADQLTDVQYNELVMLNQTSVVVITRGLLALLRAGANSSIINTVSISGKTGGSPGSSIYSATKAFVSTYSKGLARELGPDGIRVNAISPGTIDTDFHKRYSSTEKLEATRKAIPLQRLGTPGDCSPAFLFLASEKLSGYITGQVIEINGGQLIA